MKKLLTSLLTSLCVIPLYAQNDTLVPVAEEPEYALTNQVVSFQIGHSHIYDDYLSTMLYEGLHIGASLEQQAKFTPTTPFTKYYGLEFSLDNDKNPKGNHTMQELFLRGFYGAHYKVSLSGKTNVFLGTYSSIDWGTKVLEHNSNNPINVVRDFNQWASGMFTLKMKTRRKGKTIMLIDHLSAPIFGFMVSPNYTETFYDIENIKGEEDSNENLVWTSLHNRLQFRNAFSVEGPLTKRSTLRLGWVVERLKYKVNELEGRNFQSSFQIGLVHNFYSFRGKQPIPSNFITPFE